MIIDTMVFAYALLGVKEFRRDAVAVLEAVDEVIVPDSMRAELTNVLWQWVQHRGVGIETTRAVLQDTESLITRVISSELICERALEIAIQAKHTAYDALFIAAADLMETKLVTFDQRIVKCFPEQALVASKFH